MSNTQSSDYQLIHEHIEKIMPLIEREGGGRYLPHPYLMPTHSSFYAGGIFCWDCHHMAMRFAYGDRPEHLRYLIDNLLNNQVSDGFTPNCVGKEGGPAHYNPLFHAQPFMMQGSLIYLTITGDVDWAKKQFDPLQKYLGFYEATNRAPHNLFRWQVGWMSGFDNDVSTTFFQPETTITPDINAWLYLEYRSASKIAEKLGDSETAKTYMDRAKNLAEAIDKYLWFDEWDSYAAYDLLSGKKTLHLDVGVAGVGEYAFQSCSNLIPLYAGLAEKSKAERMIKRYVMDEKHFLSPYGVRSLSKLSPYYNNAVWGNPPRFGDHHRMTNSNWQGPIWVPICYFAFHGLLNYGFKEEAKEVADRTIRTLANSLKKIGSFTENFDAETGEPLYATGFASWNILADMMPIECESGSRLMNAVYAD